jgi:hypothetical protein
MNQSKKCEAEYYGRCAGHLKEHDIVYHCRPRSKDLTRGHGPFDQTKQVVLCDGHFKRIAADYENKLPELYGWDFTDALDGLTCRLEYIGGHVVYCPHCDFKMRHTYSDTGACNATCQLLSNIGADWDHCICNRLMECVCASHKNNKLHWALLTYVNGFQYDEYECDACDRPSWRDSHEEYKAGLVTEEVIIAMAKKNPELILQKNNNGKTPLILIPLMVESLKCSLDGEFLKSAEDGWGRSNIKTLEKIKKELIEVLDVYAN